MAFCRLDYFNEITNAIRNFESHVEIFCLKASLETIIDRLKSRGDFGGGNAWAVRKARICCEAYRDPSFGEAVITDDIDAETVAAEIMTRLRQTN